MSTNIIGKILLNQFRVDDFIASGGMGAVYRVWDLKRNVPLAMKVLHTDLAEDPSIFKRFQREANALKKLAHPNIVPFYGLFRSGDLIFLLERFVGGPSLAELLRQRKGQAFSAQEALICLKALSAALAYAHANGYVHCDVKPGNVLIDQGGNIFLTDFSITRYADSTTTTLASAGTPSYMAPEQFRGEAVSPATDVYALGVLLFEMLCGRRPFRGTEPDTEKGGASQNERIRYAHLNLLPPDPTSLNQSVPSALAQVVMKALAKDPKDRYSSALELFFAACTSVGVSPDAVANRLVASGTSIQTELASRATDRVPSKISLQPRWPAVKESRGLMLIAGGIIGVLVLGLMLKSLSRGGLVALSLPSPTLAEVMEVENDRGPTPRPGDPDVVQKSMGTPSTSIPVSQTPTRRPPPTSTPRASATPVLACLPTRLQSGALAYVSWGIAGIPIFSHPDQYVGSDRVGYLREAEVVAIVGDSRCVDGKLMWPVHTASGYEGWVMESDRNNYFLELMTPKSICPNTPPSYLVDMKFATVSFFPSRANNVRKNAGLDAPIVGSIGPGDKVKIIKGPECNDKMVWWKIEIGNLKGWTAEGQDDQHWLLPYKRER